MGLAPTVINRLQHLGQILRRITNGRRMATLKYARLNFDLWRSNMKKVGFAVFSAIFLAAIKVLNGAWHSYYDICYGLYVDI